MKLISIKPLFVFLALAAIIACSKEVTSEDVIELNENEFKVQPVAPNSDDEVKVISYDCSYNLLAYLVKDGFDIEIIKHFNSAMRRPCVWELDTISLGKLAAGTYLLTFTIVDISTMTLPKDTIFYTKTQELVVRN